MKKEFDSLEKTYSYACSSVSVPYTKWIKNSKTHRNPKRSQIRITDFFQIQGCMRKIDNQIRVKTILSLLMSKTNLQY
jgi:hypothetical protein